MSTLLVYFKYFYYEESSCDEWIRTVVLEEKECLIFKSVEELKSYALEKIKAYDCFNVCNYLNDELIFSYEDLKMEVDNV